MEIYLVMQRINDKEELIIAYPKFYQARSHIQKSYTTATCLSTADDSDDEITNFDLYHTDSDSWSRCPYFIKRIEVVNTPLV